MIHKFSADDSQATKVKSKILVVSVSLVAGILLIGVSLLVYVWRKKKIDVPEGNIGIIQSSYSSLC